MENLNLYTEEELKMAFMKGYFLGVHGVSEEHLDTEYFIFKYNLNEKEDE